MKKLTSTAELAVAAPAPQQSDHWLSGDAVLQRAGRDCIDHLLRNEAAGRAGEPEGIHQMRVAVRRLRAIISALAPFLPLEARQGVSDQLRWLADALGEARNLDVLALDILAPARASLRPAIGFERLAEAIDRWRDYAHAETEAAINSSRYADTVGALMHWLNETAWRGRENIDGLNISRPIGELAPMVLERCYRLVEKHSKHFTKKSGEERHQLRIALKKMRYAAELLSFLYDQAASKQFIQRVKRLQDDLGYRNDVRVASHAIATLTRTDSPDIEILRAGQRIVAWHKQRLTGNETTLRRNLHRFLAIEPFWSYRRNLHPTKAAFFKG